MAYNEDLDDEIEGEVGNRRDRFRREPTGRYVMQSAFRNRGWRRHYEWNFPEYMIRMAKFLLAASKVNGITRVRVLDTKPKDYVILYEGRV